MKKTLFIFLFLSAQLMARQTTYEKEEYKRDWDVQQNWRHDRDSYLEGEMQFDDYPYTTPPLDNRPDN
jgi:hypothetical protein